MACSHNRTLIVGVKNHEQFPLDMPLTNVEVTRQNVAKQNYFGNKIIEGMALF